MDRSQHGRRCKEKWGIEEGNSEASVVYKRKCSGRANEYRMEDQEEMIRRNVR
jgi:hypothetical protein